MCLLFTIYYWTLIELICHPFDCCNRWYVVLGLSNSSFRFLESSCAVQAFMKSLWLLEALTCSRRKDGLSCRHGVKPLTHSLTDFQGGLRQTITEKCSRKAKISWYISHNYYSTLIIYQCILYLVLQLRPVQWGSAILTFILTILTYTCFRYV